MGTPDFPCLRSDISGVAAENCQITVTRDSSRLIEQWQHGPNPEHSIEVTELALRRAGFIWVRFRGGHIREIYQLAYNWVKQVHEYERRGSK
ncbi:hypothetical protein LCGC14_2831160 [marine sediment metagenome]|uniref:Uncharacterized protein n=1 Tax=marine sediment metagenome TaxID=412755 RepID=A0A0F8Z0S4_9ZZZZ